MYFIRKKSSLIYKFNWRKDWGLGSPMGVQLRSWETQRKTNGEIKIKDKRKVRSR